MTSIQSNIGLVTGIPIQETVDQLMEVAAQPKQLLTDRTQLLESEKLAVVQLSSLLAAFQFEANQLGAASLFSSKQVSSSNAAALSATLAASGAPAAGNYLFTPVQTAASQQLLSQSFAEGKPIGAGSFTFRTGGFVDAAVALSELNGGEGVQRGMIRVTDRSGASAIIDLSFARSVDDVLQAISNDTTINVTAVADGDAFKLIDHTSGAGNLRVQNVAGGTTATDLGLAGIDTSASEATGADVFGLHHQTKLSSLNDRNGVQIRDGADDLSISLADSSVVTIDLAGAETLGQVVDKINAAEPAKLSATIAADGHRLELTDLTSGGSTFAVTNVGTGTAADDLGITLDAVGDTITGRRLVAGLRDTLASSLHGGQGLGTLGQIDITNRDGVVSNVDLSSAETLGEIIAAINDQAAGVTAAVNAARNGLLLTDTTGGSSTHFIVADGDANESATALGIVVDAAVAKIDGGALHRQSMSHATPLASLHGGTGVQLGDMKLTDSAGQVGFVDLNPPDDEAATIGDVIDRINALADVGVEARINDTGDGILLIDTAGGGGTLTVEEVGNGTTAADLRLVGTASEIDIGGTPTQALDGTATRTVTIDADHTLADVVAAINELDAGVTASLVNDGIGQRLSLSVDKPGAATALLVDAAGSPLMLQEVSRPRDALLLYGTNDAPGSGVLISSPTNQFKDVLNGVNLTLNNGTLEPVTVSVQASSAALVKEVREFVDAFNSIRETLDETTSFDEADLSTGILFGTREALRVESDLSRLLTSRFFGVGEFDSLGLVGISLNDQGRMELDEAKLTAAFDSDPESLQTLFTHETLGMAAKLNSVIEQLAGTDASLLTTRADTLTGIIDTNNSRITTMEERLDRQRERLLMEFFRIETVVAQMQEKLTALSTLQVLPSLIDQRRR